MTDSMIRIDHVAKYFGDLNKPAVNDIFLSVNKNEFLTILGPSGCGKTTTLRMIAGFEKPTSGKIFIDGEDVTSLPPYMRNVNTVFQNYALFPHLNIFDNVAFGLNMKKTPKDEIKEKVTAMLNMVQLDGYADRMPDQLSGGQKQRVAIARAIVNNPKVLLLDEPLGALDLKLRKQMQTELKHLQRKLGITFVYVTHDQEEALTMSDRIVIVNEGKIEQVGTPDEIYEKPKTKFVADFIGETNLFEGKVTNVEDKAAEFEMNDGDKIYVDPFGLSAGEDVYIAVRPERIKLKSNPSKDENSIEGKLKERIYVGSNMKTIITVKDGKDVVVNEPVDDMFKFTKDNNDVFITWDTKNSVVMKS